MVAMTRLEGRCGESRLASVAALFPRSAVLLISFLVALFLPTGASAAECTNTWTGPAESTWQTAGNWSTGKVPTETDVACIGSGKTVNATSGANKAGVVQGEGTLAISSGASLELVTLPEKDVSSMATLKMTGGTLSGAGAIKVTKTLTWNSGTMSGTGETIIVSGSTAELTAAAMIALKQRTFKNEGTATLQSHGLAAYNGATIRNIGTFKVNAENEPAIKNGGEGTAPLIVNSGYFEKTSGTGLSKVGVNIENTATVNVTSGTMSFTGGGSSNATGEWNAATGKSLVFGSGSYSLTESKLSGPVTIGEATVAVKGGTIAQLSIIVGTLTSVSGSVPIGALTFNQGTINGAGNVEITNSLTWINGTMSGTGETIIPSGATAELTAVATIALKERTFKNEGTATLQSHGLAAYNGATIRNIGTFKVNAENEPAVKNGKTGTEPLIVNSGRFEKTAGLGTSKVAINFENQGIINVTSGSLIIEFPIAMSSSSHINHRSCHGDPVECATGNFFETQADFEIGGRGVGLNLNRTYSAQAAKTAASPGAFGYGWTNSFGDTLISEEGGKKITAAMADGSRVLFTESGKGSFSTPAWSQDTLSGSAEAGYTLTMPSQTKYAFSGTGRLEGMTDRNGNATSLGYNKLGQLETITDPVGRKITLTYNGEGLVESAKDPMGHIFKYTYESKNLQTVTEPGEASANWQFKYDGSHRMTSMTDGRGGKTTNEYDSSSRVISQVDPAERKITFEYAAFHTKITNKATGAVTDEWFTSNNQPLSITRGFGTASATTETFAYSGAGQLLSKTDGGGHKTSYTYDAQGNRTSEKTATEDETKWTYNETHDLLSETKPSGEKTTITRDGQGNPKTISRPAPGEKTQTASFEYGLYGELESVTNALEHVWTYEYDAYGDRKAAIDPEGDKWTWVYDEDSRLISTVSPRGNEEGAEPAKFTTSIERDAQGRPIKVTDPLEGTTKYAYDANGSTESVTDPNGRKTKFSYNAVNERTKVEHPNGNVEETGYDGAGAVTSQTDGNKRKTTYVRNVLKQPIEVIDPLERKTTEEFDAAGNLKSKTDPEKRKTSYTYDAANRLKEISYSDGVTPTAIFGYDKNGNVTSMNDGTGESSFEYDQLDRLIHSKDGHGDTVDYEYNLADELISLTYPNGKSVSRTFDETGRLESVSDWLGNTTTFSYNRNSGLKGTTFPVGTGNVDEYTYDRADRLSSVGIKKGAEVLASLSYARDKVGQVESLISKGLPGAEEESFSYDENERLTKAGGGSYEYDAANNLTKAPGTTNTYDKASQLEAATGASFSYDQEGDRTKLTPSSGPATTYKYNQAGDLTAVERSEEGETPAIGESYGYDGTGLLASRTVGLSTHYLTWDSSESLPLLLSDGENGYIYGPGGLPVEQISLGEAPTYLHHDQLGSTRVLTNAAGEASATFSYGPYGSVTGKTGSGTTPLGFAGQYTASQSGLQYLRARFYDPATAQFMSRDPLADLTHAPYSYARGNPLRFVDPTGQACEEEFRINGISFGTYPNLFDCLGQGAEEVAESPLTGPAVAIGCLFAEPCPAIGGLIGGLMAATLSNLIQSQNNACFDFASQEVTSLIATLAGALPGAFLASATTRAGESVGLSPLGERILHIATDAPGVALEIVHALADH